MPHAATIDINLFAHNAACTVAAAIDSVLAQTWPDWRLTLIDDGSTDGTAEILRAYADADARICLKRNRCNTGAAGAFTRGFTIGDADYVMPKSADDLIAPDFVETLMHVLHTHPDCAMVHAAALSFEGAGNVRFVYPAEHCLHAVGGDPVARAGSVMRAYTSAPSFWGIYRRDAVDRLAPIAYRAGWDHVLLAELALYGDIRHVPDVLYWRRGTGRPVGTLARAATAELSRGLGLDDPIADPLWRTPCITTAYAHIETFSIARISQAQRHRLIADVPQIFGWRWGPQMRRELSSARTALFEAADHARILAPPLRDLIRLHATRLLTAAAILLPDADLRAEHECLATLLHTEAPCLA